MRPSFFRSTSLIAPAAIAAFAATNGVQTAALNFSRTAPGDAFVTSLPYEVSQGIPHVFFDNQPPMRHCEEGLLVMLGNALGIDQTQLDAILAQVSAALAGLGFDLGSILSAPAPTHNGLPAFSETPLIVNAVERPPTKFADAMARMRSMTGANPLTGKPDFDSTPLFAPIWPVHEKIAGAFDSIEAALKSPRAQVVFTQMLLSLKQQLLGAKDDSAETRTPLQCANQRTGDEECLLLQQAETLAATKPPPVYSYEDVEMGSFGNMLGSGLGGLNALDLKSIPDLLTGFLTSKAIYYLLYHAIGYLDMNQVGVLSGLLDLNLDFPEGANFGTALCGAVDFSRKNDFDPNWASCGVLGLLAGFIGCTNNLGLTCPEKPTSPTPDWGTCSSIYSDAGRDPSSYIPDLAALLPNEEALDAAGNVLPETVAAEGALYYFLWAGLQAQGSYTVYNSQCEQPPNPLQLVPGWDRVYEVWAQEEGDDIPSVLGREAIPLLTLSHRGDYVVPFTTNGTYASTDARNFTLTLDAEAETQPRCHVLPCRGLDVWGSYAQTRVCLNSLPPQCGFTLTFNTLTPEKFNRQCQGGMLSAEASYVPSPDDFKGLSTRVVAAAEKALDVAGRLRLCTKQDVTSTETCMLELGVTDVTVTDCSLTELPASAVKLQAPIAKDKSSWCAYFNYSDFWNDGAARKGIAVATPTDDWWARCGGTVNTFTADVPIVSVHVEGLSDAEAAQLPDSCQFLITQRGTTSAFEWNVNFNAQQTSGFSSNPEHLVHRGYYTLASASMPRVERFIQSHYFETGRCKPEQTSIVVSGHSLGGGLSEVYSHYLTESPTFKGTAIHTVVFAPSHGLNEAAARDVKTKARVRSIVGEYDVVPTIPCNNEGGLMRCPSRTAPALDGEGYDSPYSEHINTISITKEAMSAIDPRFSDQRVLRVDMTTKMPPVTNYMYFQMPASLNLAAWHLCSYSCWTSQNFCGTPWLCSECPSLASIGIFTPPPTTTTVAPETTTTTTTTTSAASA